MTVKLRNMCVYCVQLVTWDTLQSRSEPQSLIFHAYTWSWSHPTLSSDFTLPVHCTSSDTNRQVVTSQNTDTGNLLYCISVIVLYIALCWTFFADTHFPSALPVENHTMASHSPVSIRILDVNDNPPELATPYEASICEDAKPGQVSVSLFLSYVYVLSKNQTHMWLVFAEWQVKDGCYSDKVF